MSEWPVRTQGAPEEAYVTEGNEFVHTAGSHLEAYAFIADMHDREENLGLPLSPYRIIPCRATPNGKDIR